MFLNCIAVGFGGLAGSVLRYLFGVALPQSSFPWSTLAINVVGSFVLAAIATMVIQGAMPDGRLSLMLRVGLCGGFTTFSTFSLETVQLANAGSVTAAAGYTIATCVLCILASFAGCLITEAVFRA